MNEYIQKHQEEFDNALEHYKKELKEIRTGRANASMIEEVQVEAYETKQPLQQLASISIPDPHSISIEPWDKSILKEIETALNNTHLGLSVVNTGDRIIGKVPPMTEENRKDVVKILGQKTEDARISVRQVRDKVKEEIIAAEKEAVLTEDEKYKFLEQLDEHVKKINDTLAQLEKEKEEQVMSI